MVYEFKKRMPAEHLSRASSILVAICFIMLFSTLCAGAEPITFGVSLSLTGKYSSMAKSQERSYRLWVKETNRKGGILGRNIKLIVVDDQSNPQIAVEAYSQLIFKDKVDLLFAPFSSEITKAVMPLVEQNHYPIIASGAASDSLWQAGYKYIFGVFTPASKITVSFLEMLVMNGLDNLAILYAQDPFSKDTANGCQTWANRFGLTISYVEPFVKKTVDYNALIANARKAGSDVVIMCGHLNQAVKMKQAMDAAGWQPKVYYASQGPNQKAFKKRLKDSANYVYGTEQWEYLGGIITPETTEFFMFFTEAYNAEPVSYFTATAYAAGQILEKAISETGNLNRKALRETISHLDFNCLLGRFKVDKDGRLTKNYTLVYQIQDLKTKVVWPEALSTAKPIFK